MRRHASGRRHRHQLLTGDSRSYLEEEARRQPLLGGLGDLGELFAEYEHNGKVTVFLTAECCFGHLD